MEIEIDIAKRGRSVLLVSDDRLASRKARVLAAAVADDLSQLAASGVDAPQLEARLATLHLQTVGGKSRSCRILAQQIGLWYKVCDHSRAAWLTREAIVEHVSSATFRNAMKAAVTKIATA